MLNNFNIHKKIGDTLNTEECASIVHFYVHALEAILQNKVDFFQAKIAQLHQQVVLKNHPYIKPKITFSVGVGALIYQIMAGVAWPSTTHFGDFGIDLARAIVRSPILSADLRTFVPENKGRATVYGLTLHNTEISGHTLYLPNSNLLPLNDLPIIAKLSLSMPKMEWQKAFTLASSCQFGACLQIIDLDSPNLDNIRQLTKHIQIHVNSRFYSTKQPLVILVEANIGKALGQYCSKWGEILQNLIVIDEVPLRHAQFLHIGRLHQQILPVSFFGMH